MESAGSAPGRGNAGGGQLLPSIQATKITQSISDYLKTTFALSDAAVAQTLESFLEDPDTGIFKGPFVRVRLPFRSADDGWRDHLGWYDGYVPYGHQARAFERLSSLNLTAEKPRPQPTLITTGTGSGKTEAFLYPILDHVLRAQARGQSGIKALILYPMNALANDQARRLADLIVEHPDLAGVRAGIYTGESDADGRRQVTRDGLIVNRQEMREHAPDILLTNYKMLDQLLLRAADHEMWKQSASSLQYLVLDEFHTYDGAQGTDVAMLLRRLGLVLARYRGDEELDRPLGDITPVATSATLGEGRDPAAMVDFARTVFGEELDESAVITETRLSFDEWASGAEERIARLGLRPRGIDSRGLDALARLAHKDIAAVDFAHSALSLLWRSETTEGSRDDLDPEFLRTHGLDLLRAHPIGRALVEKAEKAVSVDELAADLFPVGLGVDEKPEERRERRRGALASLLAMVSHIRTEFGRGALSVDVHMWLRELTRVDRVADPDPVFVWGDDGRVEGGDDIASAPQLFPAVFCRNCGRSGWGVALAPIGNDLKPDDANIRTEHLSKSGRFRALLSAPQEDQKHVEMGDDVVSLRWLHVRERRLLSERPDEIAHRDDYERGDILPVLAVTGADADDLANDDTCPSCERTDSIRFMGSALATMLSVAITTIFGDGSLDAGEKKALVFTDSVQDAAHRAGFVQSRAHAFTLRNAIRRVLGDDVVSLEEVVARLLADAGDDRNARYRLLPPELAARDDFAKFWQAERQGSVPAGLRRLVTERLLFDTALEVGLQSRVGRTLELTSAAAVTVDAGPAGALASAAKAALEPYLAQQIDALEEAPTREQLIRWVRGVVERLRERGGIHHAWLKPYLKSDGQRWFVWGGRPRGRGMPAFPPGREAPAFARVGTSLTGAPRWRRSQLDQAASSKSWYAMWASDVLGIPLQHADRVARNLFDALEERGVLESAASDTNAKIYGIPPERILLHAIDGDALERGEHMLVCDTCRAPVPGTQETVAQLEDGPCMAARCGGRLQRERRATNFYRDLYGRGDMRRVVAREHSSLLEKSVRLEHETGFKSADQRPDAPNVLVATPTLEMGIDIGDLSTVMLAGLPSSVASYQQRVGRAGRLTGSALALGFVSGRGDQLARLGDPLSVIDGIVRPPATYLNAEEILRRQYLASVIDRFSPGAAHQPTLAEGILRSAERPSFLGDLLAFEEEQRESLLAGFLGQFADVLSEAASAGLRQWATPGPEGVSPLRRDVFGAVMRWNAELDELNARRKRIGEALEGLKERAAHTAATKEQRDEARIAEAAHRHVRRVAQELKKEHWISALERVGLLPNYTLLDDRVRLDVSVTWMDPETGEYDQRPLVYDRGAGAALTELAPGARFYAQGMQIDIDSIDLGPEQAEAREWRFCPACGYADVVDEGVALAASCPRCGAPGIADQGQRLTVVELSRVSAEVRRDEATINDRDDNRQRTKFTTVVVADFDPENRLDSWYIDETGLGVSSYRDMPIRWLNLGRASGAGLPRMIGGEEVRSPLFRVCRECGHLDRDAAHNSRSEHRAWCTKRDAQQDPTLAVALSRSLTTQAVALRLPPSITLGDNLAIPSLRAALLRGLREVMGGDPDHLKIEAVQQPQLSDGSDNVYALLVHDVVPGGTGYLAELGESDRLHALLLEAWRVVRECPCQHEADVDRRNACHRCLLPYTFGDIANVSRAAAQHTLESLLMVQDGEAGSWNPTPDDPGVSTGESVIEQLFRKTFMERAEAAGASIKEVPGDHGNKVQASFSGSGRQWVLSPQVKLGLTQPDFLLEQHGGGAKPIALYTDGKAFHATVAHNRLSDDAAKRRALRDLGYHVMAISWADLMGTGEAGSLADPWWFDGDAVQKLLGKFELSPDAVDFLRADPMTQLIRWMQQPIEVNAHWERIAEALPWLMTRSRVFTDSSDSGLEQAAWQRLSGEVVESQTKQRWSVARGAVALAAERTSRNTSDTDVALILDDRDEALLEDDFEDAWREWLRLSNLLSPRGSAVSIGTVSDFRDAPMPGAAAHTADLSGAWAGLMSTATPAEQSLLVALAEAGVDVPEMGLEVEGVPVSMTWTAPQPTAVLLEAEPGDDELLSDAGWTVVAADVEAIRSALAG